MICIKSCFECPLLGQGPNGDHCRAFDNRVVSPDTIDSKRYPTWCPLQDGPIGISIHKEEGGLEELPTPIASQFEKVIAEASLMFPLCVVEIGFHPNSKSAPFSIRIGSHPSIMPRTMFSTISEAADAAIERMRAKKMRGTKSS